MVGGNERSFLEYMMQSDPDFAKFADSVRGKTPQEAFREHGLDFDQFAGLM